MEPRTLLPAGTVTFLFTDIEGSTRLWEQHPGAMRTALARHDALLRAAIESHRGHIFKTIGDAFHAAFPSAADATKAAAAIQKALHEEVPQFRVRVAISTGTAELRQGDYFGPALNRAARLLAAGHGGQILVAEATAQQLQPRPPESVGLRRLGVHRLRDLSPEAIFQLTVAHLPAEFPPLNTLDIAFRRGLMRAAAVAGVVLVMVGSLALAAVNQAHRAERQRQRAEAGERTARHHLYVARLNLAQQAEEEGDVVRAQELLETQRPEPGQDDLRGFEWRYLWKRCQGSALLTFSGHTDVAMSVAFSPDGRTLASTSFDKTVRLWDLSSRRELATLRGHKGWTLCTAFSPDGRVLATGSMDLTVKLWDVATRHERGMPLTGHQRPVESLAFSPDGKTLATGSDDKTIRLWDLRTRQEITRLEGHKRSVMSVSFSPDGKTLASASQDGTVKLWNLAAKRVLATLRGHQREVVCVRFSPDGKSLASGSGLMWKPGETGEVKLWDVPSRREVATFWGHKGGVESVAFSPDGRTLATASTDRTIKIWDLATKQPVTTLKGHRGGLQSVAFSPDGRTLASCGWDKTIRLWDPTTRGDATPVLTPGDAVSAMAFSPDGRTLATAISGGRVGVWAVASRQEVAVLKGPVGGNTAAVGYSADGRGLAAASNDQTVKLWEIASRREMTSLEGGGGTVRAIAFSPDGRTLAAASRDQRVRLWDVASRHVLATLQNRSGAVSRVVFSPDGRLLAAGSNGGSVKLWEVATRRDLAPFEGAPTSIGFFLFSPNGMTLVTGSSIEQNEWTSHPGIWRFWNCSTKRLEATLRGSAGLGAAAAFSPDGRTLAVGSNSTIALWNLTLRQQVITLRSHTQPISFLAFSPDGNTLASASADGTVRLWQAARLQEADPLRVASICGDRWVMLEWRPLPHAVAYHVYRGDIGGPRRPLERLTPQPIASTRFTDRSPELVNGRPQIYAVAALFHGDDAEMGEVTGRKDMSWGEGPGRAMLTAAPVAGPPGFQGCSTNEGARSGSVAFDAATGHITLRGSGRDIWDLADGFYFMNHPMAGNFQMTVTALDRPAHTDIYAKAGIMVRESLEAGARNVYLAITPASGPPASGLTFQWRATTDGITSFREVLSPAALKVPILLRLTRNGDTITAEYSQDGGKSFQLASDPYQFEEALPRTIYLGLAITAHDAYQLSQATFNGLEIRKR